jgi:hypothetical protein
MSLPASSSNTYVTANCGDLNRNYSFNTLDNRDSNREKLVKNNPSSLTLGSDTKSTSSRKQTFADLAE